LTPELSTRAVSDKDVSRLVIALFGIIAAYLVYRMIDPIGLGMNAVLVSVLAMLLLSLVRVNVVISLITAALLGGVIGGLSLEKTLESFSAGLSGGAQIALSYALLGAFAVAISKSGIPHMLADRIARLLGSSSNDRRVGQIRYGLIGLILVFACSSQNIIPIHIAFIPLLVPPLLFVMAKLRMDRRLVACVLTFGLVTPYMLLPVGFGSIFLNDILLANIAKSGLDVSGIDPFSAMLIPAMGMIVALVGTAAALGDAGSPASDSTLGPTAGLNIDGQHNHMWDTVVPTFLHYNLPLMVFGWIAATVL
jgi:hypothetical protein